MEPDCSLPHSQVSSTGPYIKPARSSPCPPHIPLPEDPFTIILPHLSRSLPSGLFPSGFPTKTLYKPLLSPIRATCLAYLILIDLVTRIIVSEQYRSLSFFLSSFLQSPVTSSLLGQNILLSTLFSNTHVPPWMRATKLRTRTRQQANLYFINTYYGLHFSHMYSKGKGKGKAVPLQAWSGPEGSRKLKFADYMTTVQDGGKVVSLMHRPPLSPGNTPGTHFC
jgi:hypothetical protein